MNTNKTYAISTLGRLLEILAQVLGEQSVPGLSLRLLEKAGGRVVLEVSQGRKRSLLQVRPQLHPLLKALGITARGDFLLVSPHIPSGLAEGYRRDGISHADLNGRLHLRTPFLLVDREPRSRRYRNPTSTPDLFSLKSVRVVRSLLSHREHAWSQRELLAVTGVSPGLLSRILGVLVEGGHVERQGKGGRKGAATYRLADFDRLLDAWRAEDNWSRRVAIEQYSLLEEDVAKVARTVRDALGAEEVCFTQWFAARLRHPYTVSPVVSTYVRGRRSLDSRLARRVDSGGNLWLLTPKDEGVFLESRQVGEFMLASDVQIYLDLVRAGQRGPEQAEALRKWEGFAR